MPREIAIDRKALMAADMIRGGLSRGFPMVSLSCAVIGNAVRVKREGRGTAAV